MLSSDTLNFVFFFAITTNGLVQYQIQAILTPHPLHLSWFGANRGRLCFGTTVKLKCVHSNSVPNHQATRAGAQRNNWQQLPHAVNLLDPVNKHTVCGQACGLGSVMPDHRESSCHERLMSLRLKALLFHGMNIIP